MESQGTAGPVPARPLSSVNARNPASLFICHSPEIECVRTQIGIENIKAAEQRAHALAVGTDRALIAGGQISEEIYLRAFSDALGIPYEPLDDVPRSRFPVSDERMIACAAAGLLPLRVEGALSLVVAPRGLAARRVARMIELNPGLTYLIRFTSVERLTRFVLDHCGRTIADRAAGELKRILPRFSAAKTVNRSIILMATLLSIVLAAAVMAPAAVILPLEIIFAGAILASLVFRIAAAMVGWRAPTPGLRSSDEVVPTYTIIAALYHEAASVEGLINAIKRLDYPIEKLDVILAVEADDLETREAVARFKHRLPFTVVPVPAGELRTKPRALNAALTFARGTFTVIYDAEDRPDPDQLRLALQAFNRGGNDLACVQAHLCIDNTADSWLTRLFTAEYAGQFDVFLPGLAALQLPLPLGGSSNHFRTAILREVHGWDPYNVTEDADLGIRLARFGYRCETIASTTHEEAPAKARAWLHQRTRWFKGWMQTWLVHMRNPGATFRDLGLCGYLTFQLIVGGNALAGLIHPVFMALFFCSFASGTPFWLKIFYLGTISFGYCASAFVGWLGLLRRDMPTAPWVLLLTPLYWVLLSIAAWCALYELFRAPYRWKKTEHGLAKTSRRAHKLVDSLLALERELSALKASGGLPTLSRQVPNCADGAPRRRNPPASKTGLRAAEAGAR